MLDSRRRKQQGVSYRSSNHDLRKSSHSFDMLTGLELVLNDEEYVVDDGESTKDNGSDVDGNDKIAVTDDDEMMYVLSGPPSMKRIRSFWVGTE